LASADNLTRTTKRLNTQKHKLKHKKVAIINITKEHRKHKETDGAWFSHLLQHPARKRSGSILTTQGPHGTDVWQNGCHSPPCV